MTTERYITRTIRVALANVTRVDVYDTEARKIVKSFDISKFSEARKMADELNGK